MDLRPQYVLPSNPVYELDSVLQVRTELRRKKPCYYSSLVVGLVLGFTWLLPGTGTVPKSPEIHPTPHAKAWSDPTHTNLASGLLPFVFALGAASPDAVKPMRLTESILDVDPRQTRIQPTARWAVRGATRMTSRQLGQRGKPTLLREVASVRSQHRWPWKERPGTPGLGANLEEVGEEMGGRNGEDPGVKLGRLDWWVKLY